MTNLYLKSKFLAHCFFYEFSRVGESILEPHCHQRNRYLYFIRLIIWTLITNTEFVFIFYTSTLVLSRKRLHGHVVLLNWNNRNFLVHLNYSVLSKCCPFTIIVIIIMTCLRLWYNLIQSKTARPRRWGYIIFGIGPWICIIYHDTSHAHYV